MDDLAAHYVKPEGFWMVGFDYADIQVYMFGRWHQLHMVSVEYYRRDHPVPKDNRP